MKLLVAITGWLILSQPVIANEEQPSLEMLMFLAEFTDEQGNWDGPSIEDTSTEKDTNEGEQYD